MPLNAAVGEGRREGEAVAVFRWEGCGSGLWGHV